MSEDYLKKKKILIADDEPGLLEMVVSFLKEEGFEQISTAATVEKAIQAVQSMPPDLAILDVMLPDGDGFSLMEKLQQIADFPTIFLTARGEDTDRLTGLGLGADDYLVKPFLPQELVFRVLAILRRTYKEEVSLVQLKNCQIDFDRAEIIKEQDVLSLTAKEYDLLNVLYRNAGRIVTIDALCEAVWGENPFGYENTLMAHIRRIRQKIEKFPSKPVSLITIKGLGYKLIVEGS
ncbi:response regulator transcription factor [Tetragenococcus halophilus]|uniref:response regulator transcription factor n=1 Tax=Tetragenococcus halophilus TaxID=51669 RepID=UPI001F2CB714|nr:response regulator transcription factor [Tetragenococcus halophilus]MCF1685730.1 response regulator transcription factor [Tetragenococcus halophilus]